MLAAVSCRLLAACSVRALRSWLPMAISALAVFTLSTPTRISLTMRASRFCIRSIPASTRAISSRPSA